MENPVTIKRAKLVIFLLCVTILTSLISEFYLQSTIDIQSKDINLLNQDVAVLKIQNMFLENKIYQAQSYQEIASKASQMGFKEAGGDIYLK